MNRLVTMNRRVSLVHRLLVLLLTPLLLVGSLGAWVDYLQARRLTDDAFDQVLASTAIGLAARLETDRDHDLSNHLDAMVEVVNKVEAGDRMHFLVRRTDGSVVAGEPRLSELAVTEMPATPPLMFRNGQYAEQPVRAVTYHYTGPDGNALIVVAQARHRRIEAARHIIATSMVINLVMLAVIVLAVVLAVRQAIAPLHELGRRVSTHDVEHLRPLRLRGVQAEVLPLVRALNRLVARVRQDAETRQTFLSHAAHQLRTPLAGLQAQIELMPLPADPKARQQWGSVERSVQRLVGLSQRMLSLARVSDGAEDAIRMGPVHLRSLLVEVASLRLDAALARGMDLGFEVHEATVHGAHWMLLELLLNLVDNAISHCPPGSTVTVRCGQQPGAGGFLQVEDNGPGIAPQDRRRVFERFVRLTSHGQGSGLGLAIVERIALRHGAVIALESGAGGRGTTVTLHFRHVPIPKSSAI
ncbi:sensor histidine kinase [Sphaerotilus sp.]|uniref:sensor histidine kinase n=1 Tax=Sphaerotilus sp. TaxID=2093942 RepID=UPI0034E295F7